MKLRRPWLIVLGAALVAGCSSTAGGPDGTDGGDTDGGGPDSPGSDSGGSDSSVASGCRAELDCRSDGGVFGLCVAPGEANCGGADAGSQCSTDTDCADAGTGTVCVRGCGARCVPGCRMDADCNQTDPSLACGADHHCGPKPCTSEAQCPANFACASGACQRRSCSHDSDCEGACVKTRCYARPGTCESAPP